MKIDIVLVGPWERLLEDGQLKTQYSDFFIALRTRSEVSKLIYSCSVSHAMVDEKYFDKVVYSKAENKNEISDLQNTNTKNLIKNSHAGISAANSEYVVKTRSDLVISDLDFLFGLIYHANEKLIVDYEIQHTLLIPYYYSDFFIAGKRNYVIKVFDNLTHVLLSNNGNRRVFNLSPHKALTMGFIKSSYEYTEYTIWRNYLFNSGIINKILPMIDLSINDFFKSIKFLNENIILVNRRKIFFINNKFIYKTQFSRFYFDSYSILRFDYRFYFLISYHLFLFVKKSFSLILRKFNILR